jgi:hypothetical protein
MKLDDDIALALRLADAAGAAIRPYFRSVSAERKGDATPVTLADRAAEEAMRAILAAEVPRDGIVGEEFGTREGSTGRTWVLDPIDGTAGFLAGRAIFGTLIALLVDGFPVLGVIDQPIAGNAGSVPRAWPPRSTAIRSARAHAANWPRRPSPPLARTISASTRASTSWRWPRRPTIAAWSWAGTATTMRCWRPASSTSCARRASSSTTGPRWSRWSKGPGAMADWNGDPLHAGSEGHVIALGDPARLDDVIEALAAGHSHGH